MDQTGAFHLLASADRQLVLHELREQDGEATIEELSQQVAARRHRIAPENISSTAVQRAHVRLAHTHLPKLQEKDILTVNWDEEEISLISNEKAEQLFDAAEELESWPPTDLLEHPSRRT